MMLVSSRYARSASCLVAALLALSITGHGPAAAAAVAGSASPTDRVVAADSMQPAESKFASRVVTLINKRRAAHGLPKVRLNTCVAKFANGWATHLQRVNKFEHSNLIDLIKRCDSPFVSENIAEVTLTVTPRQLVSLWMHSPEHRRNILSKKPTSTGVGIRWDPDREVWVAVQNFAKKPGSLKN
jgi:uncharacterized protein YkwD